MGDECTVLLYAPRVDQARTLGGALSDAREILTVEWEAAKSDATSRLGWPDVDCLVVVPRTGTEMGSFLRSIKTSYPVLPTVYYGLDCPEVVEKYEWTTFVAAEGPSSIEPLAEQIESLLAERDRRRQQYDIDGSTPARQYPNVDSDRVDELLDQGLDRERLRELLHKSQLFDAILETIPVHLYVKDVDARHCYISKEYFEQDIEKFLDRSDPEMDMVADDHAWRAFDDDMYVIEEGEAVENKVEYLQKLDQWNITSKVPWRDRGGDIVGLIGVTRDITARKRREEEVKRQNERLESFSEIVSHDLRNPLQVAHSALTLVDEECHSEHIETVSDAHERMDAIVDDVLSLAKYGQTVIEPEPVDLGEQAIQAWETAGTERGELIVDSTLETITGDAGRLTRLLENLFRNAVEHGSTGLSSQAQKGSGELRSTDSRPQTDDSVGDRDPEVTVRVERIDGASSGQPGDGPRGFAVEDDGPGIPEGERDVVLELGYSAANGGTGYGLGVVSEIVDAHGWSIRITESEIGGARFEITGVEQDS